MMNTSNNNPTKKVIVIGAGGTFGSSTCLNLARQGYSVIGLDRYDYPSKISAGNDLNKIVRTEYSDPLYANLANEAIKQWKNDQVFTNHFHQTGWVVCTTDKSSVTARNLIYKPFEILSKTELKDKIKLLDNVDQILEYAPQLEPSKNGIKDWVGMWNENNGWCEAFNAIKSCCDEASKLGTEFISGESGTVVNFDNFNQGIIVKCKDGSEYIADYAVLCAGAWAQEFIDVDCTARCWTVGHIQLTPDEAMSFKNMPVIDHSHLGFFFEPSSNNMIKLCNNFSGYTNYKKDFKNGEVSIPHDIKYDVPYESHEALENFKNTVLPQFKHKPLVNKMICWCLDSDDGNWIIDYHPTFHKLLVASGDSGMAFKFLPTIGKYITDALEYKLPKDMYEHWKWRTMDKKRDNTRPGGDSKDLSDVGW